MTAKNVPSRRFSFPAVAAALIAVFLFVVIAARAEIAVVANDNHVFLKDGVLTVVEKPEPDNLTIVDLSARPVRVIAEVADVPSSVIGPPVSVAVAPDESIVLATSCMKVDPADATKQTEDTRVFVVDLKASPARVIDVIETGKGPAGVSINRAGNLALVANRGDGSIAVLGINGKKVTLLGRVQVGNAASALGHVVFTPDGKRALVTRDGDHMVTVLSIDGEKVALTGRDVRPGLRPYGIDVTKDGRYAVVANVGYANGDLDTVSLIDLQMDPVRVVDIATVAGTTPEGVKLSPDGSLCAVVIQNGSNKPKASPLYADGGKLVLFKVAAGKLEKLAEAPIGHWSQGVVIAADNQTIVVTNMVEQNLQFFRWDGAALKDTGERVPVRGGPAAIRTAER